MSPSSQPRACLPCPSGTHRVSAVRPAEVYRVASRTILAYRSNVLTLLRPGGPAESVAELGSGGGSGAQVFVAG